MKFLPFLSVAVLLFAASIALFAGSAFGQGGDSGSQNITLYGSIRQGWGFTQQSMSIPGPQINFTEGQLVNMTLISADAAVHNFFVDYNGNRSPDDGEPLSPSFGSKINYQFTPNRTGTFTYYCSFHTLTMYGNTNIIPELTPTAILILLIASTAIAVIYKKQNNTGLKKSMH